MKALAFDVRGDMAHFRRPDTTATHLTYPFITPTAAKGLVGAVLGIEDFVTEDKIGIRLLGPVLSVAQQMSMLGKDSGPSFNRPTTIELLVKPAYRIYYVGDQFVDKLFDFLSMGSAVYPTYLGSAYCLTKPVLNQVYHEVQPLAAGGQMETCTIVPTSLVKEIQFQPDRSYSRAGGFMLTYMGQRIFEKSIDFIYERHGKPIRFEADSEKVLPDVQVVRLGEEVVCLC